MASSCLLGLAALMCMAPLATAGDLAHRPVGSAAPEPLPAIGPTSREELEAFIDGVFAVQMRDKHIAGATVAVVKDGELFFTKGYGHEDLQQRVPVDPRHTLFRLGSISKLFTWTAIMQLLEQGKLDLDTDVNVYLADIVIPATFAEPVTLRNLMTHTAGFEDGGLGYLYAHSAADLVPLGAWLANHMPARVRPVTTDFSSGTNASYSNWGTALAGRIVEVVSGMSYDDYVERRIFAPLGMTHSTFREPLPAELATRMSVAQVFSDGAFEPRGFEFIHALGPAGSLSSTAVDLSKFMRAHLQGGAIEGGRILLPETVRLMHARALNPDPALNGSALGFYETWINGRRVIGHSGATRYFHSVLSLLPEENLGLLVSVNAAANGALAAVALERAFVSHYFPARLPEVSPPSDAVTRNARFAGTYRMLRRSYTTLEKALAATNDLVVESLPDGTLAFRDPIFATPSRWVEVGEGVFRKLDDGVFVAFKGDGDGPATHLVTHFSPIAAERIAWYETGASHAIILGVAIPFLVAAVAIRRRRDERMSQVRWARPVLAIAGGLLIASVVGLSVVLWSLESPLFEIPITLQVALTLPLLALPPVVAALFFTGVIWMTNSWSIGARLHYTVATAAALVILGVLAYWNLLGYRFG